MPPPIYRLALLADIHGNLPAFEAVLRDLEQHAPLDGILVAGDVTGGPHQQEILQRLAERQAVMIQGNGEQAVARLEKGSAPDFFYTARQFSLIRWSREHFSPQQLAFLCALPDQISFWLLGTQQIRVMHGSPNSASELVFPDDHHDPARDVFRPITFSEACGLVTEAVMVFGHTHLQWQARHDGRLGVNPGAVSFPSDGYTGAQYALLDWDGARWTPSLRRVLYDLDRLRRDYYESGFLSCSPLARVALQSILTGRDLMPLFFHHVRQLAAAAGCADLPYFPDEIWQRAEKTFPWQEGCD